MSCPCSLLSADLRHPEARFNERDPGVKISCALLEWAYFLKSESQFSTRVMGAALSGAAVLTMNLLPSGRTS
jgi:hypothetical protein